MWTKTSCLPPHAQFSETKTTPGRWNQQQGPLVAQFLVQRYPLPHPAPNLVSRRRSGRLQPRGRGLLPRTQLGLRTEALPWAQGHWKSRSPSHLCPDNKWSFHPEQNTLRRPEATAPAPHWAATAGRRGSLRDQQAIVLIPSSRAGPRNFAWGEKQDLK